MLWLALDIPQLALAVHTRGQPSDEQPPLAVVIEGRVLSCNTPAADTGVQARQSTASALALCPTLRFLERQEEAEKNLLAQLAEACFALTPTVVLAPPCSVLLEVGGCLQLFRGLTGLRKQLMRRLRQFAVKIAVAQAPTAKAALLLAQSDQGPASAELPATATLPDYLPLLRQVPLFVLPWEADAQKKLQRLHFRYLGELLDLPRPALSKRLGVTATRYLAATLGEIPDPLPPLQPRETFSSSLYFLDGISHSDGLLFPMKRLLNEFCQFLRQRQWTCTRFYWRLRHQDKSRQQILISASRGEPQVARLLSLTELKLENFSISAPIESLTLEAVEFQAQSDTRLSLLPEPGQEDAQALELLDRLRARLGNDACLRVQAQDEHRPEAMQKMRPELSTSAAPTTNSERPFWLWPEAKSIRIVDGKLWWQGELSIVSGPERILLPWWETKDERRDYFIARHSNGGHYWIYFSEKTMEWFCQGQG